MISENIYNDTEKNIEFLSERPIGWSSACLDSTIDYYLNYNSQDVYLEENTETKQYKD